MLALPLTGSTPELYHGKYVAGMYGSGEQGVWYEPSLSNATLFQDAAGTIPVTAVEQAVGLMFDKRKAPTLSSEIVSNWDFSGGTTGWIVDQSTITVSAGILEVKNTTIYYGSVYKTISVTPYKGYLCRARLRKGTSAAAFRAERVLYGNEYGNAATVNSTDFVYAYIFVIPTTSSLILRVNIDNVVGTTAYIDEISVKELVGNYAAQQTSADRPVFSARYNLLTKTEEFDAWEKYSYTVSANTLETTDPLGTYTADKLYEVAVSTPNRYVNVSGTYTAGVTYTASVYAKAAETSILVISMGMAFAAQDATGSFNLLTGIATSGLSSPQVSMTPIGDGWYLCKVTKQAITTSTNRWFITLGNARYGVGVPTNGFYIWGASLVPANQANLPYQRVNTATDYDADPVKFPPYLKFNGTNSWMMTPSIDFTGTDKMTVFAGVRRIANGGIPIELSSTLNTNAGTFQVVAGARTDGAGAFWAISSRGSASQFSQTAEIYNAPLTNIVGGLFDISADRVTLRINGAQVGQATGDQGTGNYGNYPLYIGRRAGTAYPFNGNLYSLIIRGAATDDAHLTHAEKYVGYKTGVSL